jgi:hypothetical protein
MFMNDLKVLFRDTKLGNMNRSILKNTLNIIFYTKFVLTNVISNNTKFHLSVLTVPNYRNILISF